jgi:hypothetical protein
MEEPFFNWTAEVDCESGEGDFGLPRRLGPFGEPPLVLCLVGTFGRGISRNKTLNGLDTHVDGWRRGSRPRSRGIPAGRFSEVAYVVASVVMPSHAPGVTGVEHVDMIWTIYRRR